MPDFAVAALRAGMMNAAREVCDRCARGYPVWPDGDHGVEETEPGSGVWIPPEPCRAWPIWRRLTVEDPRTPPAGQDANPC